MRSSFSIVRRLTALVVAVSLLLLCLNAYLLFSVIQPLVDDRIASQAKEIDIVRTALQGVPVEHRSTLAEAFARAGMRVTKGEAAAAEDPQLHMREPFRMLEHLRAKVGPGVRVTWEQGASPLQPPVLRAAFDIDLEHWIAEVPVGKPPSMGPVQSGLMALALVGLAAGIAIVMGVRLITRPMAMLASQVAERHNDLRLIDESQPVGIELQQVIRAFNGLVHATNRAKASRSHMLAGLSHDLRTPLARLRLRVECECAEQAGQKMERDFDALAHIIDQFLAYTQGEADLSLGTPEPLAGLVQHIVLDYGDQGVQVVISDPIAGNAPLPDLAVQRMLTNLIDNALAYGKAPIVVTVDGHDGACRLMVSDAGRGIPAGALKQALEPFVKLSNDTGKLGHCGLGLAIVAQIAGQLQGQVVQRAFDGRSSAVGVALPLPA